MLRPLEKQHNIKRWETTRNCCQYLVFFHLLSITFRQRLPQKSIIFLQSNGIILFHSVFKDTKNFFLFFGIFCSRPITNNIPIFSIGLRSGLWAVQSITGTLLSNKNDLILFEMWQGALSCMNIEGWNGEDRSCRIAHYWKSCSWASASTGHSQLLT